MKRRLAILVALPLLLAPAAAAPQEQGRAAELEARQEARLERRGRPAVECAPWSSYGFHPERGPRCSLTPGLSPYGYAYPGSPSPWGLAPYGYGVWSPPNPYRDWERLWGRGWLDGEVPPYHRFQYRFFPETLPDPTREGYVVPETWVGPARSDAYAVPAGRACARIEMLLPDGPEDIRVTLPSLGATTPEALGAVIRDRLARGAAVALRDAAGYVVRFPAPEQIRELSVHACPTR